MKILPYGDQALLVNFEQKIDPDINRQVMILNQALKKEQVSGVKFTIPAYCSLVVGYSPSEITYRNLKILLLQLALSATEVSSAPLRKLIIPVCYEPPFALDLAEVATLRGLSQKEVIALHTGINYQVYMLGFLPGFAYMGSVPEALECPRKLTPRAKVPAQSIGLAGLQTGIYPQEAPGGWQIIGKTPIRPFEGNNDDPFLFKPGDRVTFKAVTTKEFNDISNAVECGDFNYLQLHET